MASKLKGMLSLDELREKIKSGAIDTIITVFPDCYGRLVGKRIQGSFFLDSVIKDGVHAYNYLLTVDMEMDIIDGYEFANWAQGYGDFHCVPDFSTLRETTWLHKSALVICDLEMSHKDVQIAPRSMLKKQLARIKEQGYGVKAATELEYYIFKNTYEEAREKNFHNLDTFGWYIEDYHILQGTREEVLHGDVRRHLESSGIPVETSKGEWGPGQHELNYRYAEALEMADRHVVFKQALKEIAIQKELSVSFMAKVRTDLAGSSMHIHMSLWNQNDQPIFAGDLDCNGLKVSDEFRWFLGGWMKHARALTPFYAPYPNSYKRYVSQSWAPTTIAWSYDNRTAGFRVVGEGPSLRIECRIPGADANPYLAFAASLAAGLDGIKNKIEPPPIFEGDVYAAAHLPRVPGNLREAVVEMEQCEMLKEAFGEDVVKHYAHFFKTELQKYEMSVTSWERERYFERA